MEGKAIFIKFSSALHLIRFIPNTNTKSKFFHALLVNYFFLKMGVNFCPAKITGPVVSQGIM